MFICLETATNQCSVALCNSAGVISLRETIVFQVACFTAHTFYFGDFKENGISARDLEAIAVSKDPDHIPGSG